MTQGFDEWFKKRHTKSGWYEKTLLNDDDAIYLKHEMSKAYKAGAASRQAEINALSALGEMSEQKIDDLVLRNIELKKRIDELDVKLKSLEHTSKECMNAMSLSCGEYLMENKALGKVIFDIKEYMVSAPLKHVSQTAMLRVLDILEGLKGESNE